MTVSSTTRKAGPFAGNGVATVFPFAFKVFAKTDVSVTRADALGTGVPLTLDSDYSVTLNADQNNNPGGSITYPITGVALPQTNTITLLGNLAYNQPTDLTNSGGFYPSVIEDALDRLEIQIQQVEEIGTRAIQVPPADGATPILPAAGARAGTVIGFDANGALTLLPIPASVGAGDLRTDGFISSLLPNPLGWPTFVAGVDSSVTLSRAPGTISNTVTHFDAAYQGKDQISSLSGAVLTFTGVIPVGTQRIYVTTGTTLSEVTPAPAEADVTHFGADPSGVRDSTTAFLAAIATGKQVIAGEGTFSTGQIVWPDGSRFKGKGFATQIKPIAGFSTNAFWVTAAGANNVDIGHCSFNLPTATYPNTVPLYVQQGTNNHIHDIKMAEGGAIGVVLVDNVDTLVERVRVEKGNQYCFQSNGTNSRRNRFDKCFAGGTNISHGISIVGGKDHDVTNCVSRFALGFGISYFQTTGGHATGNRSGNSTLEGMQITDSSYVEFIGNTLIWDDTSQSTDMGISIAAQTTGFVAIGNKVQNNFISGNSAAGIGLASTNFGTGTTPIPGPGLPVQDNDISGNTIINATVDAGGGLVNAHGAGIILYGSGNQDNNVHGNTIISTVGTMLFGIAEYDVSSTWGPPAGNRIVNNKVIGAATLPVLKVGGSSEALTSGWVNYTPTVNSVTGAITSYTVLSCRYKENETSIDVMVQIRITTNGTAGAAINFSLPRTAVIGFGTGRETQNSGKQLSVQCAGANAVIRNYDNSYPGSDGAVIEVMCSFMR